MPTAGFRRLHFEPFCFLFSEFCFLFPEASETGSWFGGSAAQKGGVKTR
jgi:hypothetical protein